MKIPIPNILFDSLYDENLFQGLKDFFLFLNIVENNKYKKTFEEELKSRVYENLRIPTYFERDLINKGKDLTLEVSNWERIEFEKDFLISAISNIPDYYKYEVTKRIKKINGEEKEIKFLEEQLVRLDLEKKMVLKRYDNDGSLCIAILEAFSYCVDYILDEIDNYKGDPTTKIPFTLSQSKLLSFFSLLHRYEWIDNKCNRGDLSALISRYFLHSKDKPARSVRSKFSNKFIRNKTNLKLEAEIEEDLIKLFQKSSNK